MDDGPSEQLDIASNLVGFRDVEVSYDSQNQLRSAMIVKISWSAMIVKIS
jgi:hypothetical protein